MTLELGVTYLASTFVGHQVLPGLLFAHVGLRGVHIDEGRPCFLTIAHEDAEISSVLEPLLESVHDLRRGGFFAGASDRVPICNEPPVPGARLGRNLRGNPAWFVPDPARPGKYQLIASA